MTNPIRRDGDIVGHGTHVKPVYVWAVGGAVVIGVLVWQSRRSKVPASAPDMTDAGYDASGGYDDYSPATGGAQGATPGLLGYYDPSTGTYITGGDTGGTITAPSTNAQWTQQATAYLVAQGFNPLTVPVALGVYLAGGGLTSSQMNIVQAAIALMGQPPSPPPPPHAIPPTGQTQQPGTLLPAPTLSRTLTATNATLRWSAVTGATHYRVYTGPGIIVADTTRRYFSVPRPPRTDKNGINFKVAAFKGLHQLSQWSAAVNVPHR